MINYSVIIPHYNTPDLLEICLDSIPRREDIQVIIVDDNSDPAKVDFDNFPGKNREDVEIIFNKTSKGAGHARNLALEMAVGKWLLFVDADDYITSNGFEIIDRYIDSDADIVYFGVNSIFIDTRRPAERHLGIMKQLTIAQLEDTDASYEQLRLKHVNPIGKIIRRSIVGTIRFDEVWYSNDVMFSVKTGWVAKKVLVDLETVYMITVSSGSLTNRCNLNNYMSRYEVYLRHNEFMRKICRPQYQRSIMYFYIKICKYGIKPFMEATGLLVQHKGNLFIGCSNWASTCFSIKRRRLVMGKYKTN